MKLGICLPHYGRPIEVGRMLEVVRRAEGRGLDSVWVTDHVIVPQQANVIYREDMLDPLAVLPWLAGVTQRLTLGTSVVILPYRSPIPVAKLLASVDVLSGGRLIVGAAIGWLEGEFETLGVPFRERAPFLSPRIPILIDVVHRPAGDMAFIRGRHTLSGSVKQIVDELRGFQALDCGHVALEVSYSTFPAILETIDLLADKVQPPLAN